jgi:hypothetical protein
MLTGPPPKIHGTRDILLQRVEQLFLLGRPRPIRIPEQRWPSWLEDPVVAARLEAKRYKQPTVCAGLGSVGRRQVTDRSARQVFPALRDAAPSRLTGSPTNWPTG